MALALEAGDAGAPTDDLRNTVERDNRDTCRSVASLRDWLERLRDDAIAAGAPLSRPVVKEGDASEEVTALESRQNAARAQLLEGLPLDACASGHPQHPYWLLAYLVDWHRRESKAEWWEYYRLRDLPESDLVEERQAIAGLAFVERVDIVRNVKTGRPTGSVIDRYRYPLQEVELGRKGRLEAAGGIKVGDLVGHDRLARTIDIKKNAAQAELHPTSVFRTDVVATNIQQEALLRFAAAPDLSNCGADLLFRREPRLRSGAFRLNAGETAGECAVRVATALDRTTLAIQGPPGAGKTHIGAQMIRTLVRAGKKVGVTATSHKVIRNLLDAVLNVSARDQLTLIFEDPIVVGHKCDAEDDDDSAHSPVIEFDKNETSLEALGAGQIQVLGGTSWLWSREEAARSVDVLFIDEAGQMSLANALAVSSAAESLVLLGDPQQLDQPRKGSHPDGVGISALEHVLGGARTMPLDRGLFLPTTWRLHPSIAAMTSELFYDGKLASKAGLERQRLAGTGDFDGAGLWWVPVEHDGNRNASLEEVDAVVAIVDRLLAPGATWLDERHVARQLTAADLRVVAPFNAQVNRLAERLAGRGVPVGTVDKFQGQEAPVAIYSMATSRAEDAPRGMEFLYSLNRFNVATSRARCAAIVVASPRLLESACRTPRQITLANALCRYVELARVPSTWPLSAAGARESVVLLENGAQLVDRQR
jgi:AAA domain-containing protein